MSVISMKSRYLTKSTGWYEGISPTTPSTNNCLESTNATIKKELTSRNRLPVRDFLEVAFRKVAEWLQERNPDNLNVKLFASKPTKSLELQTRHITGREVIFK
jgi:hypothetical protein